MCDFPEQYSGENSRRPSDTQPVLRVNGRLYTFKTLKAHAEQLQAVNERLHAALAGNAQIATLQSLVKEFSAEVTEREADNAELDKETARLTRELLEARHELAAARGEAEEARRELAAERQHRLAMHYVLEGAEDHLRVALTGLANNHG